MKTNEYVIDNSKQIEYDDTSKTKKVKFTGHTILNVPSEKDVLRQKKQIKKTNSIVVQKDQSFTCDVSVKKSKAETSQLVKEKIHKSNSESNLESKKKINPDKIRIKFKNSTSSNTVTNLKAPLKSEDKSLKDIEQNES